MLLKVGLDNVAHGHIHDDPAVDLDLPASLPREVAPEIHPPSPRQPRAAVSLSSRLVAELKVAYAPGVSSDDGRTIGDLKEVAEWLAGLRAGKTPARPRT
jgi:hypothetical protein